MVNQDPPATCSAEITDAAEAAARGLGLSTKRMVSRAYHDSLFMARYGGAESCARHQEGGAARSKEVQRVGRRCSLGRGDAVWLAGWCSYPCLGHW